MTNRYQDLTKARIAELRQRRKSGYIYVAFIGGSTLCKIGKSLDVEKRLKEVEKQREIQFADYRQFGAYDNAMKIEHYLHKALKPYRASRWRFGNEFYTISFDHKHVAMVIERLTWRLSLIDFETCSQRDLNTTLKANKAVIRLEFNS